MDKPILRVFNFSHPLTPSVQAAIAAACAEWNSGIEEIRVRFQLDLDADLVAQVEAIVDSLNWTTNVNTLVVLPAYSAGAAILLALVLKRVGSLPRIVTLKQTGLPPVYGLNQIVALD